jgi:hypothetical protein
MLHRPAFANTRDVIPWIATVLVLVHLGLCFLLTFRLIQPAGGHTSPSLLRWYGRATGADNDYRFFTGSLPPEYRLESWIEIPSGGRFSVSWRPACNWGEIRLRSDLYLLFFAVSGPEAQQHFVDRWAKSLGDTLPGASTLHVRILRREWPTMVDYRAGQRPRWIEMHELAARIDARMDP